MKKEESSSSKITGLFQRKKRYAQDRGGFCSSVTVSLLNAAQKNHRGIIEYHRLSLQFSLVC